ncbi:hypothetical protein AB0B78_18070 [Streptomyces sp. NPDC040724]|uniref:hypothetical protein n=1 Tax=Streptomyces sp. NPDC040724 TaxID=3155612 RepID=UPI0033D6E1AB
MDQGTAAVWAAGIGVGGVVITAGMGWYAARKAAAAAIDAAQRSASAQVEAALAGVRAQLSGQHQAALWQVRRDAYATFLGEIEAVRMGIYHLSSLCAVAIDNLAGVSGTMPDLAGARLELLESFKTLWFRESVLRLAIDPAEAEQAEHLVKLAGRALEHAGVLIEAIFAEHNVGPPHDRLASSREALTDGIKEWARTARSNLELDNQN